MGKEKQKEGSGRGKQEKEKKEKPAAIKPRWGRIRNSPF